MRLRAMDLSPRLAFPSRDFTGPCVKKWWIFRQVAGDSVRLGCGSWRVCVGGTAPVRLNPLQIQDGEMEGGVGEEGRMVIRDNKRG